MKMSLEKWAEYGWLKPEPTSRDEIKSLLTIVDRDLKDADVAGLSEDRRFEAAFSAARTSADIALRASGYRTAVQAGHQTKTIESLELTIKGDAKLIQRMKTLSKKRNATSYDSAGSVSKQEVELAIKTV
jgi:MoxR-like ATPase